jgi:DNA-binding GntR family transcriptional regulator
MSSFKIKIDEPKLLSEDIAESIKTAIIKGKFKPGEKISEGELAESMGISRTPLREAFRKLENEGFIQIVPRKGAVVSSIDAEEAINLYEIKSTLEGLAARLERSGIILQGPHQIPRRVCKVVRQQTSYPDDFQPQRSFQPVWDNLPHSAGTVRERYLAACPDH